MRRPFKLFLAAASLITCLACGRVPNLQHDKSTPAAPDLTLDPNALPPTQPVTAPAGEWTWVQLDGMRCANGKPSGYAVNLQPGSDKLVVFFAGGGACGNYSECYVIKSASFISDGYTQTTFETDPGEKAALTNTYFVTSRTQTDNPFAGANFAYVPYCTGDLHAGNNVVTYVGATSPTYHVGGVNAGLVFQSMAATLPGAQRLWLVGVSAGGFGTIFNRDVAASHFPQARIDVVDDSGVAFAGMAEPSSWKLALPGDCQCDSNFSSLVVYMAKKYPASRIGLISYDRDTVLPLFFNMSTQVFTSDLTAFAQQVESLSNVHYFIPNAAGHVVLQDATATAGGTTLPAWVNAMVTDAPTWSTAIGP